jgi:hypothetical protein
MMVNFSSNDSFIGFIDLENVEIELKTVSLSCSEVDIVFININTFGEFST